MHKPCLLRCGWPLAEAWRLRIALCSVGHAVEAATTDSVSVSSNKCTNKVLRLFVRFNKSGEQAEIRVELRTRTVCSMCCITVRGRGVVSLLCAMRLYCSELHFRAHVNLWGSIVKFPISNIPEGKGAAHASPGCRERRLDRPHALCLC
jgi:hypothetical protein